MQDFRDAFRALAAGRLVSVVAILSLALGIGANTAIFSIVNSLLLKPLPVRQPDRLVSIASNLDGEDAAMSYPVWREIRDRRLLGEAFVWAQDRLLAEQGNETAALDAVWASGGFFDALGVPAAAGRTFGRLDDRPGGGPDGPVAVLGFGFAQRRFGGAAAAIDQVIVIERVPFRVVGVTAREFFGLNVGSSFDVVLPLETEPLLGRRPARRDSARWRWLHVTTRLGSDGSLEAATAALRAAQGAIRDATRPEFARPEDRDAYLRTPWTMRVADTGSSQLRSRYGAVLMTLLGLVALVLLVACANIANLQLARAAARRYQFALRAALGASRVRVARGLLVESLLLSAAGTGLGLAFAYWASRLVVSELSTWASTAFLDLSLDWRVLGVTAATTILTTVLFGTVPALRAAGVDPIEALKGDGGRAGGGRPAIGGGLVLAQIALSLFLLVAAALFLRSFATLAYRDLGFDRSRVLVAIVDARRAAAAPGNRHAAYDRVREAARAVPGVESAATSLATPLGSAGVRFTPEIESPDAPAFGGQAVRILTNPISPDWFRTFGTRLRAGRDFTDRDRANAPHVAIVNDAFARRYFDGASPIGRTLLVRTGASDDRQPLEIVGVVQDAAFASVREPIEPTVYRPLAQGVPDQQLVAIPSLSVSIRTAEGVSPAPLTRSVAAAIAGVDAGLSVSFQTVAEHLGPHYIRERLLALVSGFFGGLALLLAAIGIYGVTAYSIGCRRGEIGIRMALGADRRRILRLVLGRVLWLAAGGIAAGAAGSLWSARFVQALLFNTPARDPLVVSACALLLGAVAAFAGWLPARRATQIDPAATLRE